MAVVSHLPHVVANLLVAPGRRGARRRDAARDRPELSRRDAGRGLQPGAVGADLQRQPRSRSARRSTTSCGGWGRCARCSTPATAPTSPRWQDVAVAAARRAAAGRPRRRRRGRGAADLRGRAQPARRRGRDRARAGPRGDQHHRHVARARGRQPHRHGHAVARPGRRRRARSGSSPSSGTRRRSGRRGERPLRAVRPPARHASPRRRTSRSRTARRCWGRCRPSRCGSPTTCAREDTLSTLEALRAVGALVEEHDDGTVVVRGSGLREAREPGGPIDVGNAGTLMRLLPGWLAAQEGRIFVLDGDSSIRRRPGRPDRRAAAPDGRRHPRHRRPLPAVRRLRHAACGDRLRDAGGERAGEVLRAARGAGGRRDDERRRARAQPRPHRADARRRRRRGARATG